MATAEVNGVRLFYKLDGAAEVPLVLVHGSWASHETWEYVVPELAMSFSVLTYDRRGHSRSERPAAQGSVREDVADLAAIIEYLGLSSAWVAGSSFGASITLRLAGERPDLLRGVIAHEPPLFSLLADDSLFAPMLEEVREKFGAVVDRIASGDHGGAAKDFVETVALGPGSWAQLPPRTQQILIENAPTFLDETIDPEQLAIDLGSLVSFSRPVLLTTGEQSPSIFAPVVSKIADVILTAEAHRFMSAGHIPHVTHPEAYVEATASFIRKHT